MNIDIIKDDWFNGFKLTFNNGLTISVQSGQGNYCTQGETAEIAIWDSSDRWYNFGNDEVKGHITTEEIAEWIYRTKNATSLETL